MMSKEKGKWIAKRQVNLNSVHDVDVAVRRSNRQPNYRKPHLLDLLIFVMSILCVLIVELGRKKKKKKRGKRKEGRGRAKHGIVIDNEHRSSSR